MNTDKHRYHKRIALKKRAPIFSSSVSICVYLWLILLSSCSSTPTDMRTLVPVEALVYLESNDLAEALQPIIDNKAFEEAAKSKPDLAALKGVQLVVAVTGFESTEEKLNDELSVGSIKPRFVAVADTHAWNWQANSFAEQHLGGFVSDIYDSDSTLEKIDKAGGKYYMWTAADGRKAYALVIGSIIYFGNDETAIEKCLAVKRGQAESIIASGKVKPADPATLAVGYVSPDGVAQIASIIGLKAGKEVDDEPEVQSVTAGILPQLLRAMVSEISWTSRKGELGFEETCDVAFKPEVAAVFAETITVGTNSQESEFEEFVPASAASVTHYQLKDPQIAWRSVLLTAISQTDAVTGKFVEALSAGLFEPYGIADPEVFLSAVAGNRLLTANLDASGEKVVVITRTRSTELLKRSVRSELDLARAPEKVEGADVWKSSDGSVAAAIISDIVLMGDAEGILECLRARAAGNSFKDVQRPKRFTSNTAPIFTVANDTDERAWLVDVLSERKDESTPLTQRTISSTNFDRAGMHKTTVSDFGLIGSIIAQLASDQ